MLYICVQVKALWKSRASDIDKYLHRYVTSLLAVNRFKSE